MPHTIDIGSGEALARVLDYYGLYDPDPDGAIKIVCPFHADMNPSLLATLDNGRWHCFGCDRGGTAVEFVAEMERKYHGYSDLESLFCLNAILRNPKLDGRMLTAGVARRRPDDGVSYSKAYMYYHGLRQPDWENLGVGEYEARGVLAYMEDRGYDGKDLNAAKCRVTYRSSYPMVFPVLDNGKFRGWVSRTTDARVAERRKYLYNKGFHRANTVVGNYGHGNATVVVVEGYFDRLRMLQMGVTNVVALFGWHIANEQRERLRKAGVRDFVCALDNDEAGGKGHDYLRRLYGSEHVRRWVFPRGFKDPDEMRDADLFRASLRETVRRNRLTYENGVISI